MQPLDGPIHIKVRDGAKNTLTPSEIEAHLYVDQPLGVSSRWDVADLAEALRELPIKSVGHDGRDRVQFVTTRPLTASEAYRLGRLGAVWPETIAINQTEFELRW